jgi:hypothetical protein
LSLLSASFPLAFDSYFRVQLSISFPRKNSAPEEYFFVSIASSVSASFIFQSRGGRVYSTEGFEQGLELFADFGSIFEVSRFLFFVLW